MPSLLFREEDIARIDPSAANAVINGGSFYRYDISKNLGNCDGDKILVRPARLYPPYDSFAQMVDASIWTRWDRATNRYGTTNVTDARNLANVRTEAIITQLSERLEALFAGGRFGGQNRDWLRRGLTAAGNLGVAGAQGGPYTAVCTAVAGFVMSAAQDLWPGRKMDLLDGWRGLCRELLPIERYLLWPYFREIAKACFRAEPGWQDPQQRPSDPWRWGTQPQPLGHNIVGAGPLGIITLLIQIQFEFDSFPPPADIPVTQDLIAQANAARAAVPAGDQRRLIDDAYRNLTTPGASIPDPRYRAYVAAILCADHPDDFFCRDAAHRNAIYNHPEDPRGSAWIKESLWPNIRNRKVGELKATANAFGLQGMSPTLYTRDIDRQIVDLELPFRNGS